MHHMNSKKSYNSVLTLKASTWKTTSTGRKPDVSIWHLRCMTCYCDKITAEETGLKKEGRRDHSHKIGQNTTAAAAVVDLYIIVN